MKGKIFLLLILFALSALTNGCSTTCQQNAERSDFPHNSIVVDNRTPYRLEISSNGAPWIHETSMNVKTQESVLPGQTLILRNCSIYNHEKVVLDLTAINFGWRGCLPFATVVGTVHRTLSVGTNSLPQTITIRTWDIH
jgi:hypothetical protein